MWFVLYGRIPTAKAGRRVGVRSTSSVDLGDQLLDRVSAVIDSGLNRPRNE
jgi:hypothetical protein